ncbi:MAG: hypothetical protein M3331_01555 [Actinomycetota bacterium]|nr:hypothetical protein [Actinomycetota bacterium]
MEHPPSRTQARFPEVPPRRGHYESFYLKASAPGGGRSVWLRHTTHQRPGGELQGSLWLTAFDAADAGPRATKATFPGAEVSAPPGAYIQIGESLLAPGRARGSIAGDAPNATWDLEFDEGPAPLRHLPYEFMYTTKLPRTKMLSPHPYATFSGRVEIAGERFDLDGWPGMVGHNWGAEHAERWTWIQASDLGGRQGDYLDIAAGRIKVGPLTTPWIANGRIVLEGNPHVLGGLDKMYGTEVEESADGCTFAFPGKNVNVKGRVSAPPKDFVAWIYADPAGPEHNALNSSIADIELKIERPNVRHARVAVAKAAVYELGTRETDHGVPVQPFSDG